MILRLWLFFVLTLAGALAPSRASARVAETRTWDFFAATTESRQQNQPQVADWHQANPLFNYETASGYAQAAESRTVIGRVKDLQNLGPGEKSLLDRLPNLGNPKANWKQNSGVLREEMKLSRPIRDASPGDTGGQFLNAERNLLRDRGWNFDPKTNLWIPPKG